MKKQTTYIVIGMIAAGALGYYLYSQKKNKKVQDVKKEELKQAADGNPPTTSTTNSTTPNNAIAAGEPMYISPAPTVKEATGGALMIEQPVMV